MAQKPVLIPKGSLILVTGANSYIGSNVVDLLLELGYNIRGTVRAEKPWLNEIFDAKYGAGRFETVIVPTVESEGALDEALTGVAGVVHVATDTSLSPDPKQVISCAVEGTLNSLKSAAKHPSVKRFILTSSSSAALIPQPNEHVVVTENTWNEAAIAAAWSDSTPKELLPFIVYAASKTEGEKAAWAWVKSNSPGFVLNTVLPSWNLGRILSPHIPGSTMGWTRGLLKGDDAAVKMGPQWYVDVQDTARVHAVALLDPGVQNERLFPFAAPFNWTDVIGVLHKLRPHIPLPEPPKDEGRDVTDIQRSQRAEKLIQEFFGISGWTSLESSLANGIVDIE